MQSRFSEEEAHEILRRATQSPLGEYTRDDLIRSAAELGISPEELLRAEQQVKEEKLRKAYDQEQKLGLATHLAIYVVIMSMLVITNLRDGSHHLWVIYPLLGWGAGIVGHFMGFLNRNSENSRKMYRKWKEEKTASLPSGDL